MTIATYEGIVKEGRIQFVSEVKLPENAKVYVVVINLEIDKKKVAQVLTPKLVYRKGAARFKMQVSEVKAHAEV